MAHELVVTCLLYDIWYPTKTTDFEDNRGGGVILTFDQYSRKSLKDLQGLPGDFISASRYGNYELIKRGSNSLMRWDLATFKGNCTPTAQNQNMHISFH
jgi:hypothetical protein